MRDNHASCRLPAALGEQFDTTLEFPDGTDRNRLTESIANHIIAQTQLTGRFGP